MDCGPSGCDIIYFWTGYMLMRHLHLVQVISCGFLGLGPIRDLVVIMPSLTGQKNVKKLKQLSALSENG